MKTIITLIKIIAALTMWGLVGFMMCVMGLCVYEMPEQTQYGAIVISTILVTMAGLGTMLLFGYRLRVRLNPIVLSKDKTVKVVLALLLLSPVLGVAAEKLYVKCPFGNAQAVWTGQSKIINGQTWYIMKCINGHVTLSKKL